MKKNRVLAVLLSSMMAMPFFTGVMVSAETKQEDGLHMGRYDDYKGYEAMMNRKSITAPSVDSGVPKAAEEAVLPSSYDLRDTGVVTSVKDQGYYGTCWAFAAMGSLESQLVLEDPSVDLSEWHLAHYTYSEKFGYPYSLDQDGNEASAFDSGGNFYMLASMLTGWIGPVDEADFAYDDWDILEQERTMDEVREDAAYHVTEASLFPYWYYDADEVGSQVNAIKQAIMDGHVMSVSYYDADECHNYDTYAYYCPDAGYYYGGYHAVDVVGWDDNFSASNFNEDPGMDGAWLIKNSWGDYWGNEGYFWISYADATLDEFFYLESEAVDAHNDLYLHDDYGYWASMSVDEWGDSSAYMANVFTAEEDTTVSAAMFCTAQADEAYEIVVYTDLTDDADPTSGTASAATVGSVATMGYHTVDLDAPVSVKAGEKFSVVVRLAGMTGYHITCESATTMEMYYSDGSTEYAESILTADMLDGQIAAGESFYSADGAEWFDMYDEAVVHEDYTFTEDDYWGAFPEDEVYATRYVADTITGNVCVRALTEEATTIEFSPAAKYLAIGQEIELIAADGSDIFYSFDGENFEQYTAPIVFDGDMTIYAYTSTDETIVSRSFEQKTASLTLFCEQQDEFDSTYINFTSDAEGVYTGTFEAWSDACEFMYMTPESDGTITCNGEVLTSGETYEMALAFDEYNQAVFVFEVAEDGAKTATYVVVIDLIILDDGYTAGDVNYDGSVDANDAADLLLYAAMTGAGEDVYVDDMWLEIADFNWDGIVDANDAAEILEYSAAMGV